MYRILCARKLSMRLRTFLDSGLSRTGRTLWNKNSLITMIKRTFKSSREQHRFQHHLTWGSLKTLASTSPCRSVLRYVRDQHKDCTDPLSRHQSVFLYSYYPWHPVLTKPLVIWLKEETLKRLWTTPCWTLAPTQTKRLSPFSSKYISPLLKRSSDARTAGGSVVLSMGDFV